MNNSSHNDKTDAGKLAGELTPPVMPFYFGEPTLHHQDDHNRQEWVVYTRGGNPIGIVFSFCGYHNFHAKTETHDGGFTHRGTYATKLGAGSALWAVYDGINPGSHPRRFQFGEVYSVANDGSNIAIVAENDKMNSAVMVDCEDKNGKRVWRGMVARAARYVGARMCEVIEVEALVKHFPIVSEPVIAGDCLVVSAAETKNALGFIDDVCMAAFGNKTGDGK